MNTTQKKEKCTREIHIGFPEEKVPARSRTSEKKDQNTTPKDQVNFQAQNQLLGGT